MAPDAKRIKRLLYVSDFSTSDVYVYNYDTHDLVGVLSNIHDPVGQCEDAEGNVWITEFGGTYVFEYAHGDSHAIKVLRAGAAYSVGCSIDPKTGDLAVANNGGSGSQPGQILLFKNASGRPTAYKDADCAEVSSPGYDDKGNLYVQSGVSEAQFVCKLPRNGAELITEPTNQVVYSPGSVMWDGKNITLTDEEYGGSSLGVAIYEMKETAGGELSLVGTVELTDDCGNKEYIQQPFIVGKTNTPRNHVLGGAVVGSEQDCANEVAVWAYPGGGGFYSLFLGPKEPEGQSVSIAR
jgi:hypothetical protein